MAKATAICTCKHCGETFEKVAIKRNRREADSWEQWAADAFDVCPECERKQREEEVARAAEEAKASGMPELTGSPKQIAWAEKIRVDLMARFAAYWEQAKVACDDQETLKRIDQVINYILQNKAKTGWWIDNRHNSPDTMIRDNFREAEEAGNK